MFCGVGCADEESRRTKYVCIVIEAAAVELKPFPMKRVGRVLRSSYEAGEGTR